MKQGYRTHQRHQDLESRNSDLDDARLELSTGQNPNLSVVFSVLGLESFL